MSSISQQFSSFATNASGEVRTLFFCVQLIVAPAHWIFVDVFYVFFIVFAVSNDMVVEMSLPNVFAIFFIAKAFEC